MAKKDRIKVVGRLYYVHGTRIIIEDALLDAGHSIDHVQDVLESMLRADKDCFRDSISDEFYIRTDTGKCYRMKEENSVEIARSLLVRDGEGVVVNFETPRQPIGRFVWAYEIEKA
jgi:hypothetical protein